MDITEEIYKTIDVIVQRYVDGQKTSPQYSGVVTDSNNGKYTVLVNGSKYLVKDGVGINPKPNTTVWIMVPNNDWNQAYICAGKNNKPEAPVSTVLDVWENGTSVVGSDMIARINCATTAQVQQVQNNLEESVQELQENFQAGVDAIGNACTRKGSTPASSSLEDTVAAIDAIQTGGNYDTLNVSFGPEGTVYDAKDYPGIDAWNIVRVVPPEAPFTVRFFDDDRQTILKTDANVPYGGSASCTELDGTVVGGLYFKGWNPNPTCVKENMNCYPLRGDYIIDANEIQDDWGTICADGGAHYPLGSYKALVFSVPAHTFAAERTKPNGDPFTITANLPAVNIAMHMVKVAEGEDGSTSSWISTGAIMFPRSSSEGWAGFNIINQPRYEGITFDWGNSAAREWLHNIMLPLLPQPLVENIKDVTKYYKGYPTYSNTDLNFVEKSSLDKIWIPSVKEFYTKLTDEGFSNGEYWGTVPSSLADMSEINGVDYSTVYVPTYSEFLLRTGIRLNDQFGNKFLVQFNDSNKKWYAWSGSNYGFPFGFCL